MSSRSISIVAAANDEDVLAKNLLASPLLAEGGVPLHVERGHSSAGRAYNAGASKATTDLIVFAHQDVYLPRGWEDRVAAAADALDARGVLWGLLGVCGKTADNDFAGRVWSTGLGQEIRGSCACPAAVVSVDELAFIVRRDANVVFDEHLPGYHLYGTDIVQSLRAKGYGSYVIDAPVIHNSIPIVDYGLDYLRAYWYVRNKWRGALPLYTSCLTVTTSGWPYVRRWWRTRKRRLFNGRRRRTDFQRHDNPQRLAQELGFEA